MSLCYSYRENPEPERICKVKVEVGQGGVYIVLNVKISLRSPPIITLLYLYRRSFGVNPLVARVSSSFAAGRASCIVRAPVCATRVARRYVTNRYRYGGYVRLAGINPYIHEITPRHITEVGATYGRCRRKQK